MYNRVFKEIKRACKKIRGIKEEPYQFYEDKTDVVEKITFKFPFEEKYKCIFIHIPKTAGCSVTRGLFFQEISDEQKGLGHININWYKKHLSEESFENYFKFTFVRNPWDRVVSAYSYLLQGGHGCEYNKYITEKYLKNYNSFEKFVLSLKDPVRARELKSESNHFRPQYVYICNNKYTIMVDYIAKVENIQTDFEYIADKLKIPNASLPFENKSNHKDYRDMYTSEEMINIVSDLYYNDIKFLKYKF